jgi:hypothetical protein
VGFTVAASAPEPVREAESATFGVTAALSAPEPVSDGVAL